MGAVARLHPHDKYRLVDAADGNEIIWGLARLVGAAPR